MRSPEQQRGEAIIHLEAVVADLQDDRGASNEPKQFSKSWRQGVHGARHASISIFSE
jgi:hypothetical protein